MSEIFSAATPADAAMTVVALNYLGPTTKAMHSAMAKDGKLYSEDDTIRQLIAKDMSDPVTGRRLWWYSSGYLVRRLDRLAAADASLAMPASQVWAHLIDGAQFVPNLLRDSVVWSAEEKGFTLSLMSRDGTTAPTPRDAMHYVLRRLMPKAYQGAADIEAVREKHGLTFFGP